MALHITNTQSNDGENEGSKPRSTLKEYLSDLPNVYAKLQKQQMTDLDIFIFITEDDLKELCGKDQLNLKFTDGIKFKSAIRKLQAQFAPKKHIVAITMDEQKDIDMLNFASKQANDIQTLFENHFNQIENHIVKMKSSVDAQFDNITNTLEKRKRSLYKQIEEWKLIKLENINKEISNIIKYKNELKSLTNQCDELLLMNNDQRPDKIKKITQQIFENNKLFGSFSEYIVKHTKMTNIKFDANLTIFQLKTYGTFENNDNILIKIPKIQLKLPTVTRQVVIGRKVTLKWQASDQLKKTNYVIKFKSDDNDEKKNNDETNEWIVADKKQIKANIYNDNEFEVEINNIFEYGVVYNFNVELKISQPIRLTIKSNIVTLQGLPKGNAVKIELQYHSHRKHYPSYHPKLLLTSTHQHYHSALNNDFNDNEPDWVVFKFATEQLYFPTKFVIKNFGKTRGVKQMKVFIGDGNNQWFECKSDSMNMPDNNEYQSYVIGIDYNVMTNNTLRYVKLHFITNHGGGRVRFKIAEFQLHGIIKLSE